METQIEAEVKLAPPVPDQQYGGYQLTEEQKAEHKKLLLEYNQLCTQIGDYYFKFRKEEETYTFNVDKVYQQIEHVRKQGQKIFEKAKFKLKDANKQPEGVNGETPC